SSPGAHALSGCIGAGCLLRRRVEGIARVLQCPLWASCKVRVEVRGDINSTLLQKPMDVSQFWRRYCQSSCIYRGEAGKRALSGRVKPGRITLPSSVADLSSTVA